MKPPLDHHRTPKATNGSPRPGFPKADNFSDRIMQLLRDRIALSKRDELLDYLDLLIPDYEIPADHIGPTANNRMDYDWSEFLDFHGEDFIRNAYLCILKREAGAAALQSASAVNADERSRVIFLGRLRYSEEGQNHATQIKGLRVRYRHQLASMEQKPLIRISYGFLIKLQKLFRSRIDEVLVGHRRELARCNREISKLEVRLMQHHNTTLNRVKHEVAEALTADIKR